MQDSNSNLNLFQLGIDMHTSEHLKRAAYWARIIALAGFISAGLSVIVAFANRELAPARTMVVTFTIIFAIISILINMFLYRFATHTKTGITDMSQEQFNEGINGLQTYFKIIGILLIIMLSIVVLAVPVFIVFMTMGMGS